MKKNGFIATSLIYSFFLVFISVITALAGNYIASKNILHRFNDEIVAGMNDTSTIFITDGNGTITGLTNYGKTLSQIEIPYSINGVVITTIGEKAFSENTIIESIDLGNVSIIEDSAFLGTENLTKITFSSEISEIGDSAFYITNGEYLETYIYNANDYVRDYNWDNDFRNVSYYN